jgi:hypothetical protein
MCACSQTHDGDCIGGCCSDNNDDDDDDKRKIMTFDLVLKNDIAEEPIFFIKVSLKNNHPFLMTFFMNRMKQTWPPCP